MTNATQKKLPIKFVAREMQQKEMQQNKVLQKKMLHYCSAVCNSILNG